MPISAHLALRVKQATRHMEYLREELAYEKAFAVRWSSAIADLTLSQTASRLARLVRADEPGAIEQYLKEEVDPILRESPTPEEW